MLSDVGFSLKMMVILGHFDIWPLENIFLIILAKIFLWKLQVKSEYFPINKSQDPKVHRSQALKPLNQSMPFNSSLTLKQLLLVHFIFLKFYHFYFFLNPWIWYAEECKHAATVLVFRFSSKSGQILFNIIAIYLIKKSSKCIYKILLKILFLSIKT